MHLLVVLAVAGVTVLAVVLLATRVTRR